jgi:hypothetical protein
MSNKVNYSIIQAEDGLINVQSKVTSFSLDHITDKDISSFYSSFSQYAAFDSGLLPVEGSGILSIRTAGEYTQFAYQHKPGTYHLNWGGHEGDRNAKAYYIAQPYRIIICDMIDGNLLGARMFYSPYPITFPNQPLYHVNLPNINCKGYRGNGVGWICLYHNEDWSSLPLNERIVRFIERCSGVETYNDANMSETDGPRFYAAKGKPTYITDPTEWQDKTEADGFEWTLDPELWIPVLVQDADHQDKHYEDGIPLTFADALIGDYQAYYSDSVHTKPINAIIRPDKKLSADKVLSYFVKSYNQANVQAPPAILNDTFNKSSSIKDNKGSNTFIQPTLFEDNDSDNQFTCHDCEESWSNDESTSDVNGNNICPDCLSSYTYIESLDIYVHEEDNNLVYVESIDKHFHQDFCTHYQCPSCYQNYATESKEKSEILKVKNSIIHLGQKGDVCISCIEQYANDNDLELAKCVVCNSQVIESTGFLDVFPQANIMVPVLIDSNEIQYQNKSVVLCPNCATTHVVCPCGLLNDSQSINFNPCTNTQISIEDGNQLAVISSCCSSCLSPVQFTEDGPEAHFSPSNLELFNNYINSTPVTIKSLNKGLTITSKDDEPF